MLARIDVSGAPNPRAAAAVKAAMTQLGVPYVWGGTKAGVGLDCSGLTQWAYRQAGMEISRTTYTQVEHGIPVPCSAIAVGDLVFPHSGHVQMYIGNGKVIEEPYTGASCRISQMPTNVYAIRRMAA